MLHYVHQPVTKCVCLLCGAGQVTYSRFLELYRWKMLLAAVEHDDKRVSVNQNSKALLTYVTVKQCAETHYKAQWNWKEVQIQVSFDISLISWSACSQFQQKGRYQAKWALVPNVGFANCTNTTNMSCLCLFLYKTVFVVCIISSHILNHFDIVLMNFDVENCFGRKTQFNSFSCSLQWSLASSNV